MALVQSKRSVAYICLIVASRTMVFDCGTRGMAKSFVDDNISSFFLKHVAKFLLKIFNTSLETSNFPDSWKTAKVAPIRKDGDKSIQSNYRPISVLPVVSRVFEKLVFNQLYKYLDSTGLLSNGQSGISILTCLLKTTDE